MAAGLGAEVHAHAEAAATDGAYDAICLVDRLKCYGGKAWSFMDDGDPDAMRRFCSIIQWIAWTADSIPGSTRRAARSLWNRLPAVAQ